MLLMIESLTVLPMNVLTGKTKLPFFFFYFCHLEMQDKAADKCHVEFSIRQTDILSVRKGMAI